MNIKVIKPNKDETYKIAYDDKCLVIQQGNEIIWISKAMANWIVNNFVNKNE